MTVIINYSDKIVNQTDEDNKCTFFILNLFR